MSDGAGTRMLDSVIMCPHCGEIGYRVFRVQNVQPDGRLLQTFRHEVEPVGERLPPLRSGTNPCCLDCGTEMRRVKP